MALADNRSFISCNQLLVELYVKFDVKYNCLKNNYIIGLI